MALTVPYATKLARALEPLGLKWMEEFLPPDSYDGYKEVRENLRGCNVMLTTGEHEYSRYVCVHKISYMCAIQGSHISPQIGSDRPKIWGKSGTFSDQIQYIFSHLGPIWPLVESTNNTTLHNILCMGGWWVGGCLGGGLQHSCVSPRPLGFWFFSFGVWGLRVLDQGLTIR